MATQRKAAVISADVVGSSKLKPAARKKLQTTLDGVSRQAKKIWKDLNVQQYRGDSVQAILTTSRPAALRIGLLLQSCLIRDKFQMRISIGMGDISYRSRNIITSDGTAFMASGRSLDGLIKSGGIITIAGNDPDFTGEWQTHSVSLNYVIQRWTPQQAEAVYLQLQDYTQLQMARKLKIRQPSVHQRLQAAGWPVLHKILQRFESVVPAI